MLTRKSKLRHKRPCHLPSVQWASHRRDRGDWVHVFCRSCLVKYSQENTCPTCRIVIQQSHPLQYSGHDRTMQDIVYKLPPGLQEAGMGKQRGF